MDRKNIIKNHLFNVIADARLGDKQDVNEIAEDIVNELDINFGLMSSDMIDSCVKHFESIWAKAPNQNVIKTYTGKYLDVIDPDPTNICIEDIAHALSYTARWGGHSTHMLNVAQHSCQVAAYLEAKGRDKRIILQGLMHDASEAYLGDMPSPIKKHLPKYQNIEYGLMTIIADKLQFDWPEFEEVRHADKAILTAEKFHYINQGSLKPMTSKESEELFLMYYNKLTK